MTVEDLIKKKDYDYIEWRVILLDETGQKNVFAGCTKSKDGMLISLDGDTYDEKTEILSFEEWNNEKIDSGLTIMYKHE